MKRALPFVFDRLRQRLPALPWMRPPPLPPSDGTIERAQVDIVHFPTPGGFITSVPSLYQPHDIQHLHLPHLFSAMARLTRELHYRTLCGQAATVAVVSSWTKRDLIQHYGLPPEKIAVVPYAPILSEYPDPTTADLAATRAKYRLPDRFVFYPAQTFRHKNHIGLIDALAKLRGDGLLVPFVSSGRCNEFYPLIRSHARKLRMEDQVRFLGFVSPLELQCLWRLARAAVIPTRFEAASFPVWEAFLAGTPVACSNVTSLPEQAGDSAILFGPDDTVAMADAVRRLWTDEALCRTLVERGRANVSRFSWDRTARMFRAHYRSIAARSLSDDDRALLSAPPLL